MFFPRLSAAVLVLAAATSGCRRPAPAAPARPADGAGPRPPAGAFAAHVDRVVDGDTVIATRQGRRSVRVRVIGIDTPETDKSPGGRQCYGDEASAYAARVLRGRRITAAYERGAHYDKFGRELWDIWLPDGTFYAGQAVDLGYARPLRVPPDVEHAAYLAARQQAAAAARTGLWAACPQ